MDATELRVLRRQTTSYIAANPESVSLVREVRLDDGAGGYMEGNPSTIAAQTVRIIQKSESEATERRNRDGEVVRPSVVLLAEWDANVQVGDEFVWEGMRAEVVYISDMKYELVCEVAAR